jgi:hypothetical protein
MNTQQATEQSTEIHRNRHRQSVAEAAYYKAENRGFTPGFDWQDWVEAEMEVFSLIIRNADLNSAQWDSDA